MKNTKFVKILLFLLCLVTVFSVSSVFLKGVLHSSDTSNSDSSNSSDIKRYSSLTYVAFGTSTTQGVTPDETIMENPYPKLVSEALGLKAYDNQGLGGGVLCENDINRKNMTEHILNYKGKADIISLMIGTNDFSRRLPLGKYGDKTNATFYGSLYLICEYFEEKYPDSFIFFMTPTKTKYSAYEVDNDGNTLNDFAEAIRIYAKKYNYPLLDMYYYSGFEEEMFSAESDGVHPSENFHKNNFTPKIVEFIRKNTNYI